MPQFLCSLIRLGDCESIAGGQNRHKGDKYESTCRSTLFIVLYAFPGMMGSVERYRSVLASSLPNAPWLRRTSFPGTLAVVLRMAQSLKGHDRYVVLYGTV